ncbi:MAG: YezD family protein [Nitrospiraceae bacterium]
MVNADEQARTQATVKTILQALSGIRYGSIEIVVHDSEVVQIERKEKFRLGAQTGQKE